VTRLDGLNKHVHQDPGTQEADDARLIAQIYDLVLEPQRYDDFMESWAERIFSSIELLTDLRHQHVVADKLALNSELENHFERAFAILEKMGRNPPSSQSTVHKNSQAAFILDNSMKIKVLNNGARENWGDISQLDDLVGYFDADMITHIRNDYKMMVKMTIGSPSQIIPWNDPSDPQRNGHLIIQPIRDYPETTVRLLFEELPVSWNETLSNLLVRAFSLTSTETGVVRELVGGLSLGKIAKEQNKSVHTVRTQLKSALHKIGATTQADLVRIVSALARYDITKDKISDLHEYPPAQGEARIVHLKDGRKMVVHEIGDPDGIPVVFIHGMLDGVAFNKSVAAKISSANIRMISPVRSCFGESDPLPDGADCVQTFIDDLVQVLDAFGIDKFHLLGHMGGALYTFAAAAAMPDRVHAVVNASGGVPIVDARQFDMMSPRQKLIAVTARYTPRLLPTILRAGIYLMDSGGSDKFMQALYQENTHDRLFTKNPEIRAAVFEGYRFAVAQGHRAFELDAQLVTRNWSSFVDKTKVPVYLHHGVHDPVVHISSVRKFAARYSNITLFEQDDTGQTLFFEYPERVIDTILQPAEQIAE